MGMSLFDGLEQVTAITPRVRNFTKLVRKIIIMEEIVDKCKYKCKDCAMFADEDADSPPYCLAKDLYTFVMGEDEACEEFVKWNGKK